MKNVVVKAKDNSDVFCEIDGQKYVNLSKAYALKGSFDIYIKTADHTYLSVADNAIIKSAQIDAMPLLDYYYNNIGSDIKTYAGPIIGVDEKYLSNNFKNALIRIMATAITSGKQLSVYGGRIHQCPEIKQI